MRGRRADGRMLAERGGKGVAGAAAVGLREGEMRPVSSFTVSFFGCLGWGE